ncbi:hypothetical protein BDZ89DRAFT_888092, partial [Hymenopellis radicata]
KEWDVSSSSIGDKVNGKRSMSEANADKQLLTPKKESTLVSFILESAEHGFPIERKEIEMFADAVLETRTEERIRKFWYYRFMDHHHDRL